MQATLKNKQICIQRINFDSPGKISLKLEDGRIIIVPLKYFPELSKLPLEKRKKHTIVDDRTVLFTLLIQYIILKILWDLKANGRRDKAAYKTAFTPDGQ